MPEVFPAQNRPGFPTYNEFSAKFGSRAFRSVVLLQGVVLLMGIYVLALASGDMVGHPSKEEELELEQARDKLWSLSRPRPNIHHRFIQLDNGLRFHYLLGRAPGSANTGRPRSLIVLLHGWPDSSAVWTHQLMSPLLVDPAHANAIVVAPDLPGFGGSDGLPEYTPRFLLDALARFILAMRDRYLNDQRAGFSCSASASASASASSSSTIVCGHDWGGVLTFRLAEAAPSLADRFIVSNVYYPLLLFYNMNLRASRARAAASLWLRHPTKLGLLRSATADLTPVFHQMRKSWYISLLQLPMPLAARINSIGHHAFLRIVLGSSNHDRFEHAVLPRRYGPDVADKLASSLGPGPRQCADQSAAAASSDHDHNDHDDAEHSPLGYSDQVRKRALAGGWTEQIRLYRDDLVFTPWTPAADLRTKLDELATEERATGKATAGAGDLPEGAFTAPMTLIWGTGDVGLDQTMSTENASKYFCAPNSQVVTLPDAGHWALTDPRGRDLVVQILAWAVAGRGLRLEDWPAVADAPGVTISEKT